MRAAAAEHGARVVRSLDEARWAAFVGQHPHGTVFHTPQMHRALSETSRHRPDVLAEVDGDGEIRALLTPVTIATLGGPLRSITGRVVAFAGPLAVDGSDGEAAVRRLLTTFRRTVPRSALFVEIRHIFDPGPNRGALAVSGFTLEPHLNFFVDLTAPTDVLWGRLTQSTRRNVAKARREGVTIIEATDEAQVAEGYAVLEDVYRRIQVPLPDRSLFEAAARRLGATGSYRMLLARAQGETIGVLTLLGGNGLITYWYTGTLREHAKLRAGDLLVWHAIEMGHDEGYRSMDFGGAGQPDVPYGVRDFKAKFGGDLVAFGRDLWVPSPTRLRLATAAYRSARRFL